MRITKFFGSGLNSNYITEDQINYIDKFTTVNPFTLYIYMDATSEDILNNKMISIKVDIDTPGNDIETSTKVSTYTLIEGQNIFLIDIDHIISENTDIRINIYDYYDDTRILETLPTISYVFKYPIFYGYLTSDQVAGITMDDNILGELMVNICNSTSPLVQKLIPSTDLKEIQNVYINDPIYYGTNIYLFIMYPTDCRSLKDIQCLSGSMMAAYKKYYINGANGIGDYVLLISSSSYIYDLKNISLHNIKFVFDGNFAAQAPDGIDVPISFQVATNIPIDSRFSVDTISDLTLIRNPYAGMIVYVRKTDNYYKYTVNGTYELQGQFHLLYEIPIDELGSIGDKALNINTGIFYEKKNHNHWVQTGRLNNSVITKVFNGARTYYPGDVVSYEGITFQAKKMSEGIVPPMDPTVWEEYTQMEIVDTGSIIYENNKPASIKLRVIKEV